MQKVRHHTQSLRSSNAPTAFHVSSSKLGTLFLSRSHTSLQRAEEGAEHKLVSKAADTAATHQTA